MIIIFDLDHTLLDTHRFKNGLAKALGISEQVFTDTYKKQFLDREKVYNIDEHILMLLKKGYIETTEKIKEQIKILFSAIDDYLFPEAEQILKDAKKRGHRLILLTYGSVSWQKRKVADLKIKHYFDKIIFTDCEKSTEIEFLKHLPESVVIVNDNAREALMIKEALGRGKIFLVKGPYLKNVHHNLKIHRLSELKLHLTIKHERAIIKK